jgi:polyferredoxin
METGRKAKLLRPKVLGYAAVLLVAVGLLAWSMGHQAPYDMSIAQVRQPVFVQLSDGRIQNRYEIKLNNKTSKPLELSFSLVGLKGAELDMRFEQVRLEPEQRLRLMAAVRLASTEAEHHTVEYAIRAVPQNAPDLPVIDQPAVFYLPGSAR